MKGVLSVIFLLHQCFQFGFVLFIQIVANAAPRFDLDAMLPHLLAQLPYRNADPEVFVVHVCVAVVSVVLLSNPVEIGVVGNLAAVDAQQDLHLVLAEKVQKGCIGLHHVFTELADLFFQLCNTISQCIYLCILGDE